MMEFLQSERMVWAALTLMGAVGWFAVQMFFVTRTAHERQRAADQEAHEAQRKADNEVTKKLAETVDKLASRMVGLESRVNALPTEAMLHNLNVSITALASTQQGQQSQLDGIGRTLERIQQYLMEHK